MPRKRKTTLSGAAAAPPTAPVDVPYGQAEPMIEAQRRTPVPMTAGTAQPAPAAAGAPGQDPYTAALAAAQTMAPPTSALTTPSTRPNEHLTAGMGQQAQMPKINQGLWELRELTRQYGYEDMRLFLQRAMLEQ